MKYRKVESARWAYDVIRIFLAAPASAGAAKILYEASLIHLFSSKNHPMTYFQGPGCPDVLYSEIFSPNFAVSLAPPAGEFSIRRLPSCFSHRMLETYNPRPK